MSRFLVFETSGHKAPLSAIAIKIDQIQCITYKNNYLDIVLTGDRSKDSYESIGIHLEDKHLNKFLHAFLNDKDNTIIKALEWKKRNDLLELGINQESPNHKEV